MRRLGVDPGSRRTGLALSESELSVACPLTTLAHKSAPEALRLLCEVIDAEQVGEVIVGLPLRLDGTDGEAARRARRLAADLTARTGASVVLWDERLSTVAAERALSEQGVRGRQRRQVVDQAAATLLLQSYLDAQRARDRDHAQDALDDFDPAEDFGPPAPVRGGRRGRGGRRR